MIETLIDELITHNIKVEVVGKVNLKIHTDISKIPAGLLSEIRMHKDDLVQYLVARHARQDFGRIQRVPHAESYALCPTQRRLWILSQFAESNVAYNVTGAYAFNRKLNEPILREAFNAILERHESLRTIFLEDAKGEVRQYIQSADAINFCIQSEDLRYAADPETTARDRVRLIFTQPFDLSSGPLIRAALYQVGNEQYVLAYAMHHIISDGWSMELLLKELLCLYDAFNRQAKNPLAPLRIQYKDYAAWLQQQLKGENLAVHRSYWLHQFRGELPVLSLPAYKERPAVKTYNGAVVRRLIGKTHAAAIRSLCRQEGCSLFMGMLALTNALFYRYTAQEDIIIGTPVAGRDHVDLEDQIGFYVNTIALRTRFSGRRSFRELLHRTRATTLEAYEHQVYPFDELVDALELSRDISRSPLFDVQVIVKNAETSGPATQNAGRLSLNRYREVENTGAAFDMVLSFAESEQGFHTTIVYNKDVYARHMVERLAGHLERLLQSATEQPDLPVCALEYITDEEKLQLLEQFNGNTGDYDPCESVVTLFERQVQQHADVIAVTDGKNSFTYRQLSEASDNLARYLKCACGVQPEDMVSVMVERGTSMIVSLLAILKAGAVYVPVDPEYPAARRKYIVDDSKPKVLLTETRYVSGLDFYTGNILAVDELPDMPEPDAFCPLPETEPHHLAYIIYTSGSTGEPKGVMIQHGGLSNSIQAQLPIFNIRPAQRSCQFTSPSFDVSVFEIFITLLSGASLYMIPEKDKRDAALLAKFLTDNRIEIASIPPAYVRLLDIKKIQTLKKLVTGGEALVIDKVKNFLEYGTYFNAYGPTECSICASVFTIRQGEKINYRSIPIGKPIDNCRVYILDDRHALVAGGVTGEICIGGAGVACGYLGNPALTAEKFIDDPFLPGGRIYKTGDLGRWLPNGDLEFLGRKDEQVKVHGYRIEPGEIEKLLQDFDGIGSSLVLPRTNKQGIAELVAYYTSKKGVNALQLRAWLRNNLPAYMVPDHFVDMKEFPLTPNGKIDRNKLPEPSGNNLPAAVTYVAPRNEPEQQLIAILEEVLGKENIGIDDDYFELGGSSLKAMMVVKKVRDEMKYALPMKILFEKKTVRLIAEYLSNMPAMGSIDIATATDPLYTGEASYNQLSYFSDWIIKGDEVVVLCYEYPDLNIATFSKAFKALADRHESLRTVFVQSGDTISQSIRHTGEVFSGVSEAVNISAAALAEIVAQEQTRDFNLFKGPLFRLQVYRTENGIFHIVLALHHSITDGWSAGIIQSELMALYAGVEPLQPLRFQNRDFAAWQRNFVLSPEGLRHKEYWLNKLKDIRSPFRIPAPADTPDGGHAFIIDCFIQHEMHEAIDRFAKKHGLTRTVILMGALALLLNERYGENDIVLCTTVSGRNSPWYGDLDITGLIGFFANLLLVRNQVDGAVPTLQFLKQVQENFLDDLEYDAYPIGKLIHELPGANQARFLQNAVFFNYHNYGHARNTDADTQSPLTEEKPAAYSSMHPGLVLAVTEFKNCLRLRFVFHPSLFTAAERAQVKDQYLSILHSII